MPWRLVDVEDDRQARHEEECQRNPKSLHPLLAPRHLKGNAEEAEEQWQEVVSIAPLVVAKLIWQIFGLAQCDLINKRVARQDASLEHTAITLQVVLTADEVPAKVTPVHIVNLIAQEVLQVVRHRGLRHIIGIAIHPTVVTTYMLRLRRVHTREEHLAPRGILDLRLVVYLDILVRFVWIALYLRCIDRLTLLHGNRTSHVGSTIQVRDRTILLTVDVALDRKRRVRLILIHWRASQRTH